jgi:hypothetical protein
MLFRICLSVFPNFVGNFSCRTPGTQTHFKRSFKVCSLALLLLFIMRIVHKVHINIKIYEVHNAEMKQLMSVCVK